MSLAVLVDTGNDKKRAVAYINVTDLVADERLDLIEETPASILTWIKSKKFELAVITDEEDKDITGSID